MIPGFVMTDRGAQALLKLSNTLAARAEPRATTTLQLALEQRARTRAARRFFRMLGQPVGTAGTIGTRVTVALDRLFPQTHRRQGRR